MGGGGGGGGAGELRTLPAHNYCEMCVWGGGGGRGEVPSMFNIVR